MADCPNCNMELMEEDLQEGVCSNCRSELGEDFVAASMGVFYGEESFNLWG